MLALAATPGSEGSFWGFVQGLKWLCPSLAPMIDKVNRHSGAQKGGASGGGVRGHPEAAIAWLTESVQDHSFLPQLDVLVGNREHLHSFYHGESV
ncbi:RUN domain Beclin-1 interacting and cysteine-rich containing protein-like [Elysia marginata]|uniref:RUN domain Beclin-1 interacting and cysteine-rich containing protein-like n=1 Tax=Elysia marginata TaxID=1093978 RepID=A0AAV4G1A6_9GAST|nr:RUN domain Beclin-1 interacting and cysteine-rich containing protein-like [Elysia marginata]